jgi:hypothetical protein
LQNLTIIFQGFQNHPYLIHDRSNKLYCCKNFSAFFFLTFIPDLKVSIMIKKNTNNLKQWICQNHINSIHNREKGTTFVVSVCFGVITIGFSAMAIINSSKTKINAVTNDFKQSVMATAETGIIRSQDKLNSLYPYYLTLNYKPNASPAVNEWANPPSDVSISPCAPDATTLANAVIAESLDSNARYEIKSYEHISATNTANLVVQGRNLDGGLNSQGQIEVSLEIEQFAKPGTFPGLYAEQFVGFANADLLPETPGSDLALICTDCTSDLPPGCVAGEPSTDYLEDAIDLGPTGVVQADIMVGESPKLPDFPEPPTSQCSATEAPPCYILVGPWTTNVAQQLPRPSDITDRQNWGHSSTEPYNYILDNTGSPQYRSFTSGSLTVDTTNAPVRLYATGNIELAGSEFIAHTGSFEKFALLGCTDTLNSLDLNGNYLDDTCVNPMTDQTFLLSGGATTTNIFIYALNAQVGVNGGSSSPDFRGVLWTRAWGRDGSAGAGSSSNNAEIVVPDNAAALVSSEFGGTSSDLGAMSNRIKRVISWKRKETN